jgi:hypothetical protein
MPQSQFLDLQQIVRSAAEKTRYESPDILLPARNLRARADEASALAEIIDSPHTRQMMGAIAATYDKVAERLETEFGGIEFNLLGLIVCTATVWLGASRTAIVICKVSNGRSVYKDEFLTLTSHYLRLPPGSLKTCLCCHGPRPRVSRFERPPTPSPTGPDERRTFLRRASGGRFSTPRRTTRLPITASSLARSSSVLPGRRPRARAANISRSSSMTRAFRHRSSPRWLRSRAETALPHLAPPQRRLIRTHFGAPPFNGAERLSTLASFTLSSAA